MSRSPTTSRRLTTNDRPIWHGRSGGPGSELLVDVGDLRGQIQEI